MAVLLDSLREAGAHEQAAALAGRAAAHAPLDDPGAVASLLDSLREAGAHEQAAALAGPGSAAHAALDDPDGVASLLDSLREAGAHEQAAALLARDPPPTPPSTTRARVASLLDSLREAGAHEQAAALLARDPPPTPPSTTRTRVASLLDSLREAGAHEQAAALAARAAAHAALDDPGRRGQRCWTACGRRARTTRPPRWQIGCRRSACSGSSSSRKAPRISSVSDGRPTAPRPRHGAGKTWTYGLFPGRGAATTAPFGPTARPEVAPPGGCVTAYCGSALKQQREGRPDQGWGRI